MNLGLGYESQGGYKVYVNISQLWYDFYIIKVHFCQNIRGCLEEVLKGKVYIDFELKGLFYNFFGLFKVLK